MLKQIDLIKAIINGLPREYSNALDATSGKGNDTLFLCNLVKEKGRVIAIDVQDEATLMTNELLEKECRYNNYEVITADHSQISSLGSGSFDLVIYNLGYLPNSDKKIVTSSKSTVQSLEQVLEFHLNNNGLVFIISYLGHKEGKEEYAKLTDILSSLDYREYTYINIEYVNMPHNPSRIMIVEKR